ncbi:hypothetical protein AAE478_004552 [Parahypoxylon ruwenzoriense]
MVGHPKSPIVISDGESELDEFKQDLAICLDGIRTSSRVATCKEYDAFVNPGLTINDTLIPLPLVGHDAEIIRNSQGQFYPGTVLIPITLYTVVAPSVRKTWELDHTQFTCKNPAWKSYVTTLVNEAAQKLSMSDIRAEPYKLLLYEEGSFFKSHKDSEKAPGMIATLVICLPSKHDGGGVHLSHAGKSYVFETDKTSDFGLTSLAWFSDVTHEIEPLRSGYRLVLTYNVLQVGGTRMSASVVGKQSSQLRSLLEKWRSGPEKLVYKLEHKYTQSSLSLNNLKGRDRAVCQCLYEVGLETEFTIFLSKMTRTRRVDEEWYDEDDDDDNDTTELEDIKTHDGYALSRFMSLEDEEILGENLWKRTPDEIEEDFTVNESTPAIFTYHDTVVIIVPTDQLSSCLSSYHHQLDPRSAMSLLGQSVKERPNDQRFRDFARMYVKKVIESDVQSGSCDVVVDLLDSGPNDMPWLTDSLVSTLSECRDRGCITSALRRIYEKHSDGSLPGALDVFKCILESCMDKVALDVTDFPQLSASTASLGLQCGEARSVRDALEVIDLSLRLGLSQLATEFLNVSLTRIRFHEKGRYWFIYFPTVVQGFLESLVSTLRRHRTEAPRSAGDMFSILIRKVLHGGLPKYPKELQGWKFRPRGCEECCEDCQSLDSFLEDSEKSSCELHVTALQHGHLNQYLPETLFQCHVNKTGSKYKLVVIKLATQFQEDVKEYQAALSVVEQRVKNLRCEYVENLMEEPHYRELVMLEGMRDPEAAGLPDRKRRTTNEDTDNPSAKRPALGE